MSHNKKKPKYEVADKILRRFTILLVQILEPPEPGGGRSIANFHILVFHFHAKKQQYQGSKEGYYHSPMLLLSFQPHTRSIMHTVGSWLRGYMMSVY